VLLVILIASVLLAIFTPKFKTTDVGWGTRDVALYELDRLATALDAFYEDVGRYPTAGEGLDALYTCPPDLQCWHGPYLERPVANDPWHRPFVYIPDPAGDYRLFSLGRDGLQGTADDIPRPSAEDD